MTKEVDIAAIAVAARHRKDMGDIGALARSIADIGLLHPLVVTPNQRLIAGERRLRACQSLGWRSVPVTVIDLDEIVRGEHAENAHRKDFTLSEAVAIKRALEPLERAAAKARMGSPEKFSDLAKGNALDKIAKATGVHRTTLAKAEAVVDAASAEPEKYAKLLAAMDRTGRANGPYQRLKVAREAERIRAEPLPLPNGKWRVAGCDVPWPSEPDDPEPSDRGYWPFPTMSIEALCALDIGSRLHDDAVLWFWTTNFHMRHAFPILEAWGVRATPTILTWGKDRPGRGQRLLGQTEHAIMAIRGNPVVTLTNQTTLLLAPTPKGPLGRKPPEFYAMVERLCPAPRYLDLFSSYQHNDIWDCWGAEAPL